MEKRQYKLAEYLKELYEVKAIPKEAQPIHIISALIDDLKSLQSNN